MQITKTPGPNSTVLLEIEVPPERVSRAMDESVRHLAKRTRVPGFRPGKAPRAVLERHLGPGAVLEDAVDHLVQDSYRDALISEDIVPLTNAEVDVIDDAKVDQVLEELRDQNATLAAVEGRGAKDGDYAVISFTGSRDGEPFEGGSSERMPLILGQERLIPGFEANLVGLEVGGSTEFDITFPEDYPETALAGAVAHFAVELRELREKVLPDLDEDFIGTLGDFADVDALRADIKSRLERNALDRARHGFADRIIEYAVANATLELPDILVDQEVEVMHDEFRATIARQGISEEAYLKAVDKTDADLHAEFRPGAEKRVRTLLVLSTVADAEGVTVPDADVEAEVGRGLERYPDDAKLREYFLSDRGRSYIRSTLRRSRVVEGLIDEWLVAHPDHQPLPHLEDAPDSAIEGGQASANAAVDATDPGSILDDVPTAAG
jgi:trigger factor